ncbi:hypothetical protein EG347_04540 [Chryseobacterium sp. G0186]|uniref:hypothetical protein n=1 Tax=Chryseobacterium sp. G0186 TaxID=2487064 RepID=UPI000F509CDA|nr:hypothetical protein [Chryseobacterium sp. G0186]AZA76836.1 hypothetical protein EG347_04540 [Chryseobacterium sp. G0186]
MKQEEINSFIENNLKNFSVNSTGWNDLIRQMLFEFAIGGWNMKHAVFGKEKFGELCCAIYSEDKELNVILGNITDKYSRLSGKICEICGSEGKMRTIDSWQTTLCLNHFLEQQPVIDIDEKLDVTLKGKKVLNLTEVSKAEVEYDFQGLWLYEETELNEEKQTYFSWQEPNYFLLLKTVPLPLFPEDSQHEISELFTNLKDCEICGYKAIHKGICLRCHNESWRESEDAIEDSEEKISYIKEGQMDIFMDDDDHEKCFKYDRSFEKVPDHQILFSYSELHEYEKLLF